MTEAETDTPTPELTALHLDVYNTRDGPWNPEHGDVEISRGLGVPADR